MVAEKWNLPASLICSLRAGNFVFKYVISLSIKFLDWIAKSADDSGQQSKQQGQGRSGKLRNTLRDGSNALRHV